MQTIERWFGYIGTVSHSKREILGWWDTSSLPRRDAASKENAVLKSIIDKLEDVNEGFRGEYRPGTADEGLEGKFVLSVEGRDGWGLENVTGLRNALSTERTALNAERNKVKAFEGIDPVKAKEALAKIEELGTLDPKKDVDRLVEEKVQAQLGQLNERHKGEITALEGRLGMRDALLTDTFKTKAAVEAIAEAKGDVELLLPHVLPSISFDLEEADGKLVPKTKVVDASGNVRIGDSQGGNMTIKQRVEEMKTSDKFSRLFDGSGHQGSGDQRERSGGGGGGGQGKKIATMSRREKAALIGEIGQQAYNERANQERAEA